MKTLDEAIAKEKEMSEPCSMPCANGCDCMECRKEHKQLAECLEELKTLRAWKDDVMEDFCKVDCGSVDEVYQCGQRRGYNKALDDFVNMIKEKFPFNKNGICNIEIIVEQLKAGEQND